MRPSPPRPAQATHLSEPWRWRRHALCLAFVPMFLHSLQAGAAPFAARATEADPPTGDTAAAPTGTDAAPAEAVVARGTGIRWAFAPARWGGSVGLAWRRAGADGGNTSSGSLVSNIEFASYVWQPWFIQVGGGLGLVLERSRESREGGAPNTTTGRGLTGSASASVFPMSRFPFGASLSVGDSRAEGETMVSQYRTLRLGLRQSWTPMGGGINAQLSLDHSRVRDSVGMGDRMTGLQGSVSMAQGDHQFEVGAQWTVNSPLVGDSSTRQGLLKGRHNWQGYDGLTVDNMATWTDLRQRSSNGLSAPFTRSSRLVQVTSMASWRPAPGQWFYSEDAPLVVSLALRAFDSAQGSDGARDGFRSINLTAGASKEFSRQWMGSAGLSLSDSGGRTAHTITAGLNYMPPTTQLDFGGWRWAPSWTANTNFSEDSGQTLRSALSIQGGHSLSRAWLPYAGQSIRASVSQGLGWSYQVPGGRQSRGLSHSGSLYWQGNGERAQSLVGLSVSESRTRSGEAGKFQSANLQVSRRSQLSRYQSWSADLTVQMSRSDSNQLDPFTGELRRVSDGWQRYASGSIMFESQRVFGVPRLRFSSVLSLNSQQFERRSNGDFNAPLENISESFESRLEWTVGRLDTRLSARVARVDGRTASELAARIMRRF